MVSKFILKNVLLFIEHLAYAAAAKSLQSCLYSVRPHRQQPTRLPCPWGAPGKNMGGGCPFLLQGMKGKRTVKSLSRVQLLVAPWTVAHQALPSMGFSQARVLEWVAIAFSVAYASHRFIISLIALIVNL